MDCWNCNHVKYTVPLALCVTKYLADQTQLDRHAGECTGQNVSAMLKEIFVMIMMFLRGGKMFFVQAIKNFSCHATALGHCENISCGAVGFSQRNHVAGMEIMRIISLSGVYISSRPKAKRH